MPRHASLSMDLLETFLALLRNEGDVSVTAQELDILQPSMSKRLNVFLQGGPGKILPRPWLVRDGKTWRATEEGLRVRPAVEDIIRRYDELRAFVDRPLDRPQVSIGCGQHSAQTFVADALARLAREQPSVLVRMSTPRGTERVERVASGAIDLAVVSQSDEEIEETAGRPLYVKPLFTDPLVVVCTRKGKWAAKVEPLAQEEIKAHNLVDLPLVLPEPDANVRANFERAMDGKDMHVVVEGGGWGAILRFVEAGLGVGLVNESSALGCKGLIVRRLDPETFPPRQYRLIARRLSGIPDQPDLSEHALRLHDLLIEMTAKE